MPTRGRVGLRARVEPLLRDPLCLRSDLGRPPMRTSSGGRGSQIRQPRHSLDGATLNWSIAASTPSRLELRAPARRSANRRSRHCAAGRGCCDRVGTPLVSAVAPEEVEESTSDISVRAATAAPTQNIKCRHSLQKSPDAPIRPCRIPVRTSSEKIVKGQFEVNPRPEPYNPASRT